MPAPSRPTPDDSFAALLVSVDEALARGEALPPGSPAAHGTELTARLARGQRCVELLSRLRPGRRGPPPVPAELGRFKICRELGRGGFGIVYLAHDPLLKRDVALKVPRLAALVQPELAQRFAREAQAGARLDHPNVAAVYDAGEVAGVSYIASAYCSGITLAQWLQQRQRPLAPAEAAALVARLADAVEHGHSRGILHRDLKPSNVVLAEANLPGDRADGVKPAHPDHSCRLDEAWYCPKITDFGLARVLGDDGQTRDGAALGTPSYMAPEQTGSGCHESTAATDVYGLGAILYELLVGRPPFVGESPLDVLDQVRRQEVVAPRRLRPRLPRDLETICLKCLAKTPSRRYASAAALAEDLRRFLAGKPIRARPIGPLERGWLWCRQRPLVAALSAALAAALAAGIGGAAWQWQAVQSTRVEKELAQQAEDLHRKHAEALTAARLIAMAHSAWLMDRQDEARRLLDECPVEHRTAEWANLHALGRARQKSLHGVSPAGQQHVFFSSTGKYFGITHFSHGGDIPIYDSDAGNLHMRLRERRVECAAFGPDDRTLAVVTSGRASEPAERKLVVWDLATRTRLREVLLEDRAAGRMSFINSVISGSQVLAWVSPGLEPRSERELPFRDVVVWDAAAGRVRHTLSAAPRFAYGLAITPDGRRLAIAQPPDALVVVDPQTGSQVATLACEVQPVSRIALGDDGLLLAWSIGGAGFSNEVRVWNLETGKQSAHVALHHRALWIDLSADGRLLAVACADSSVQLFATSGGRHMATLRGHAMGVVSVAFSPTSQRLVSADGEGVALLWDISPWSAGSGR